MKKIIRLLLFTFILVFSACQKQPHASFNFSKTTVFPGDNVKCTNTSTNGSFYKWTLSNGNSYNTRDLSITAGTTIGDHYVKLEAFSRNGKKISEITNKFKVIDFYNKLFVGSYNPNSTNTLFSNFTTIVIYGNDKITIDGGFGGLTFDFIITSSTNGNLVPKTYNQFPETFVFKTGSIVKNGNTLNITMTCDYTDATNPSNNEYNITFTDVLTN
jgi:hypothetical protein